MDNDATLGFDGGYVMIPLRQFGRVKDGAANIQCQLNRELAIFKMLRAKYLRKVLSLNRSARLLTRAFIGLRRLTQMLISRRRGYAVNTRVDKMLRKPVPELSLRGTKNFAS